MWKSAFGSTSCSDTSNAAGTGAPADMTRRMLASAAACAVVRPDTVAATVRSAAGEAKTMLASTAAAASASLAALSVPGSVTSMSGAAEPMPRAGPSSANGANAATSRSSGVTEYVARQQVELGAHLAVAVDHPLRGSGGPGGEHHRAVLVGRGRRGEIDGATERR